MFRSVTWLVNFLCLKLFALCILKLVCRIYYDNKILWLFFSMRLPPLTFFLRAANGEGCLDFWTMILIYNGVFVPCVESSGWLDFSGVWGWQAELHTGSLPQIQSTALRGEKLHRVFHYVLDNLVNVMNGYCLPDPFFSSRVWIASLGEGIYK